MVLSVESVTLEFEGLRALSDVSFVADSGALTALVGPNGAGKTSLLNCIGGFYAPTRGRVALGDAVGEALGALGAGAGKANAELRRAKTPRAQAAAARKLQTAYRRASNQLAEQQVNPADASANARLVAALAGVAKAYDQAADAAAASSKPRYQQARRAVTAAQRKLDGALEGLRAAGYEIGA